MLDAIIKNFNEKELELFGKRMDGNKCVYCGEYVDYRTYCTCQKSKRTNRYFKKIDKKLEDINAYSMTGNNFKAIQDTMFSFFNTPEKFAGMTFEDYQTNTESEEKGLILTVKYHREAIKNFAYGSNLLYLGNYGTGKSMLMSILCNSLAGDYLFTCKFINGVNLIRNITDSFKNNDKSVKDILGQYQKTNFLFLDDIDKIKPSDYVREVFYDLVNYRSEKELPTIISANHNLEQLDESFYGEAIISRLVQGAKIINFTHKNRRFE